MNGAGKAGAAGAALAATCLAFLVVIVGGGAAGAAPPPGTSAGGLLPGSVPADYQQYVLAAGQVCPAVTSPLIAAQIQVESGWNPNAVSPTGAQGLSQFEPATWAAHGIDGNGDGTADPFDAPDAIASQASYDCALAADVAAVPGDVTSNMLAAYNAGPGAVLQYQGIPPYPETQNYVAAILALIPTYTAPVTPPAGAAGPVLTIAMSFVGTPYLFGGAEPGGFDCSGLVQYAFQHGANIALPHSAAAQAAMSTPVAAGQEQPGDVVYFDNPVGHIVIGGGQMVDAPHTGAFVRVEAYSTFGGLAGFGRLT